MKSGVLRVLLRRAGESRLSRGIYLMGRRYLRHNVGIHSAALAFYLLFMIFPFLIFISALLGMLQLNVTGILVGLRDVLPKEVVGFIGMYLTYVGRSPSPKLMLFGLFFSVYTPMRATNTLMRSVRTAYHLGPPKRAIIHTLKTLLYTVLLIGAIVLSLVLVSVSDRLLSAAVAQFHLPSSAAALWQTLRYPLTGAAGYFAVFFLYALAQDEIQPWRNIWPGTVAALAAWLGVSWLYGWYVENIAQYSLLYGSIGTIIVLLIWLNISAMTLIMGAELNGTLMSLRKEREEG